MPKTTAINTDKSAKTKSVTQTASSPAPAPTTDNDGKIHWLDKPEDHDYTAAASYLGLIFAPVTVTNIIARLQTVAVTQFKAKDVLRASGLALLKEDNKHVKKDLAKIDNEKQISPILLVRDSVNAKVIIADGYHRVCAVYLLDEDTFIPCQITGIEG